MKIAMFLIIRLTLLPAVLYPQNGWIIQPAPGTKPINQITFIDQNTGYLIESTVPNSSPYGWCYKSTNGGSNWFLIKSDSFYYQTVFFINNSTGWIGGESGLSAHKSYLYKTTDGGASFVLQFSDLTANSITALYFFDSLRGWAGGGSGWYFKTTDGGTSWFYEQWDPYSYFTSIKFINALTGWVTLGTGYQPPDTYVLKTVDGGNNWTFRLTLASNTLYSVDFANINTGFVCGTNGKIYKSTNSGNTWQNVSHQFTTTSFYSVKVIDQNKIFICGWPGRIISTDNSGSNWALEYSNATSTNLYSVSFADSYTGWVAGGIYPSTPQIFKTTTGGITPIHSIENEFPKEFITFQNYPNPFNPVTTINFELPRNSYVVFTIFDILGREIETLVNQNLIAGTYKVDWDASNYPSGVYYYRLTAGDYSNTKKMTLIK